MYFTMGRTDLPREAIGPSGPIVSLGGPYLYLEGKIQQLVSLQGWGDWMPCTPLWILPRFLVEQRDGENEDSIRTPQAKKHFQMKT